MLKGMRVVLVRAHHSAFLLSLLSSFGHMCMFSQMRVWAKPLSGHCSAPHVLSQAEKDLAEGLSGATAVSLGRALFPGWADSNDNGVKRFAKSHRA